MKHLLARLARIALTGRSKPPIDPDFDRRLQRCATRETLRPVRSGPFRTRPAPPEA